MKDSELVDRVMAITSASDEAKKAIVKRYYHYKSASDEELLQSCIIIEGFIAGAEVLRADAKQAKDDWLTVHNELVILRRNVREMRDVQTGFFKSPQGSRDRQEFLRRSKMMEKLVDDYLERTKPKGPTTQELFSK